jgi:predicted MPP superfamily phosphohydrolase
MVFIMLITPTPFILQKYGVENSCINLLIWAGSLSLGFFSFVSFLLVSRDLMFVFTGFIQRLFRRIHNSFSFDSKAVETVDINRRRFMINSMNLGILGISGSLSAYGFYEARRPPAVVEVSVPFRNLPDDLEGFRIVQITDTHVGTTTRQGYMETIVERVNMLTPDIVVFTGDIADGTVSHLGNKISPLSTLVTNYGSYFVTGNHEYLFGEQAWLREIDRLGLKALINEHQVLTCGKGRITLAGVTDYSAGKYDSNRASNPETSLSGSSPCDLKILLAHRPRSIYAAAKSGFDLQISGHTHGGQFYPWRFACFSPYVEGLHRFKNTWIYVSRGTGYWGAPLRLGVTSEITLIKLSAGNLMPNLA